MRMDTALTDRARTPGPGNVLLPGDRDAGHAGGSPLPVPSAVVSFVERLIRSKAFVVTLLVLPGVWPVWPMFVTHDFTVLTDPGKYLLHHLGFTASVILAIVLTLSPLRVLLPHVRLVQMLQRHRRLIGVTTFVYAVLHVTMHFIYEGGFGTFATDWKKPFIMVGLTAFSILLVLAATSFNAVVRRMGARPWKWLHRLVYVAAILVVYHQISARKIFPVQVIWIFGPVLLLELARIGRTIQTRAIPRSPTAASIDA
jgi:methionine sulfoxide reductase heme-binding subunit